METMVVNSKGSTVVYKQADLKYDLEKKFIMLTDKHTGNSRQEAQKPKNETTEDNRSSPMSLGENGRKKRRINKTENGDHLGGSQRWRPVFRL